MNWHKGNIAEAVAESKAKDAVFVVYIEGQDEMSVKLNKFLSDARVSSKLMTSDFVAVKVEAESPTYQQFSSLYKVVPVPSIFFIGKSGTPLDVTTGIIANVEELVVKIEKVLILAGKQTNAEASSSQATATVQAERSIAGADDKNDKIDEVSTESSAEEASPSESSSEASAPEAIAVPKELLNASEVTDTPTPNVASQSAPAAAAVSSSAAAAASLIPGVAPLVPPQATLPDIQQRVEQKKLERQEEQKRLDKENELRRRREGRESQVHQAQSREQELKTMQERIKRERLQEQQNRERILAQIAADRAEQANRSEVQSSNTSTTTNANTVPSTESSSFSSATDETRLQIRLPGGITRTKAFPVEEPLSTVRVYVVNELLVGSDIRDFTLATSYPRREFKTEDEVKTLIDLNLVPNAVLLVLKRDQVNGVVRTGNNLFNILSSVLWAILTPATMALDYLNKIGFQRIKQRFMQMVSNVGLVKSPDRPIAGNLGASAMDASSRRNMGMFQGSLNSREAAPHMPDSTSDDATSTQSADPQYQSPNMFFSEASVGQQAAQQRAGGAYKRFGESNIRRLADTTKDEDDKATYNGNSTQQQ